MKKNPIKADTLDALDSSQDGYNERTAMIASNIPAFEKVIGKIWARIKARKAAEAAALKESEESSSSGKD